MLIHQIASNAGGMTIAMMTRAKVLNSLGARTHILTTDTKANYTQVENSYRNAGRIDDTTRILNMYAILRSRAGESRTEWRTPFDYGAHLSHIRSTSTLIPVGGNSTRERRYFARDDSAYVMYERVSGSGHVESVEFFNSAHTRTERWSFDPSGNLYRSEHFDPSGHKVIQDKFWTSSATCFLMRWLGAGDGSVYKVLYFGEAADQYREFNSQRAFEHWFLESLTHTSRKPIFIGDGTGAMQKLMDLNPESAVRIMQIHSNHYSIDESGKNLKPDHDFILTNSRAIDRVVVLTNEQRAEVVEQYEDANVSNIPNAIPIAVRVPAASLRRPVVIAVTRLAKEKQLDKAIYAFSRVVREVPDAVFEIYGSGPEEPNLRALTDSLGLTNSVRFPGFSNDVATLYDRAAISVMTSAFEGQGLAMGESLAYGIPAVAFDFSYGPRSYLGQNQSGIIVPPDDIDGLAGAMLDLLTDPARRELLARNGAQQISEQFSVHAVAVRWNALISELG